MKNTFLANLNFTDRAYPVLTRMPAPVRSGVASWVPAHLAKNLKARGLPDRITIFVTDECNLRCPHCFIITDHQEKVAWSTGLDEYRRLFTSLRGGVSHVLFTGGEPTLRKDLGEILAAAEVDGKISQAGIFTHGLLKDRLLTAANYALDNSAIRLNFQVSIDGAEAFHDANRGVKGGLNKTLASMDALRELDQSRPGRVMRRAVCTAVSRENIEQLPGIIDLVRERGWLHAFTFVRTTEVWGLRAPEELSNFSPDPDFDGYLSVPEMHDAIAVLRKHLWDPNPGSLYFATNRVALETIAYMHEHQRPKAPCQSGKADLTILANGDIARCENLRAAVNLKDYDWDLARLLRSDEYTANYKKTVGCYCTQDCALNASTMYSKTLLKDLFTPPSP